MNTELGGVRLAALTKELITRWHQTQESWRDEKAREFDTRFMVELESSVASATSSISNLERILRKIRTDCES